MRAKCYRYLNCGPLLAAKNLHEASAIPELCKTRRSPLLVRDQRKIGSGVQQELGAV
jgi:hypothetical protein